MLQRLAAWRAWEDARIREVAQTRHLLGSSPRLSGRTEVAALAKSSATNSSLRMAHYDLSQSGNRSRERNVFVPRIAAA